MLIVCSLFLLLHIGEEDDIQKSVEQSYSNVLLVFRRTLRKKQSYTHKNISKIRKLNVIKSVFW